MASRLDLQLELAATTIQQLGQGAGQLDPQAVANMLEVASGAILYVERSIFPPIALNDTEAIRQLINNLVEFVSSSELQAALLPLGGPKFRLDSIDALKNVNRYIAASELYYNQSATEARLLRPFDAGLVELNAFADLGDAFKQKMVTYLKEFQDILNRV